MSQLKIAKEISTDISLNSNVIIGVNAFLIEIKFLINYYFYNIAANLPKKCCSLYIKAGAAQIKSISPLTEETPK